MKNYQKVSILTILLLIISCSNDKKNILGGNDINLNFETYMTEITETAIIDSVFSFEDTTGVYLENSNVMIGQKRNIKAFGLFRFIEIPEDISEVISADFRLNFSKHVENPENVNFNLAKMNHTWVENQANINEAYDDTEWDFHSIYEILDTDVTVSDTTIYFHSNDDLTAMIEEWTSEDSLKNGICVFPETFIEDELFSIYSTENTYDNDQKHEKIPHMILSYKTTDSEETILDTIYADYDTFINDGIEPNNEKYEEITIANINPQLGVLKLDFDRQMLLPQDSNLSEDEIKRITINRAELLLTVEEAFYLNNLFGVKPYVMSDDFTFESELPFDEEMIESVSNTDSSFLPEDETKITVDITSIIQGYVSGSLDNNGILLAPEYRNQDFNKIKFYDNSAVDSANKPKLKVIYTLPIIND